MITVESFPNAKFTLTERWNVEKFGVGVPLRVLRYTAGHVEFESPLFDPSILATLKAVSVRTWVTVSGPANTNCFIRRIADWDVPFAWQTELVNHAPLHTRTGAEGTLLCEWAFNIKVPLAIASAQQVLRVWWYLPTGFAPTDPRAVVDAFRTDGTVLPRFQ